MCCRVYSCCFCIQLRDSVFIFGYLRLFFGLTIFVVASALLSSANLIYPNLALGTLFANVSLSTTLLVCISAMVQGMLITGTSLLLIVGGHRRKALPIRAYFWISLPALVIEFAYGWFICIVDEFPFMLFGLFIALALEIYFIIVIRSIYLEIDMEQVAKRHGQSIENPLTPLGQ